MTADLFPRHGHRFGERSRERLTGVLPELIQVADLAIDLCEFDGTILAGGGMRTEAQAADNVARGTGVLNSLHRRQPDGFGHAIDIVALTPGKGVDWTNLPAFRAMALAVQQASAILSVPVRQGCDWNANDVLGEAATREWDWPHFEKPRNTNTYPDMIARCERLMRDRRKRWGLDAVASAPE